MTKLDNSQRQAFQVRFRATDWRIAAPHETDGEFVCHFERG
jgi:hypothetical protein